MRYYLDPIEFIIELYRLLVDIVRFVFGGKKWRLFVRKVPYYCRHKCEYVYKCRSYRKGWRTVQGCGFYNYWEDKWFEIEERKCQQYETELKMKKQLGRAQRVANKKRRKKLNKSQNTRPLDKGNTCQK